MEIEVQEGRAAIAAASERLDSAGMQARFQIALSQLILDLFKKEQALGLDAEEFAIGLAGFMASAVETLSVNQFEDPASQRRYSIAIAKLLMEMMEEIAGGKGQ